MSDIGQTEEAGIVSIFVTMVIIVIISLIVLGFAQVARRNERQGLDRRLSTQAFYAAESGINDVRQIINNAVATGGIVPDKPDCSYTNPFYNSLNTHKNLDASGNIQYTCVIVSAHPTSLQYSGVGSTSTVAPILSGGTAINKITINWTSDTNSTTNCPTTTNGVFSTSANWLCSFGVLRFDLVPISGNFDQAGLLAKTMTSFAVPFSSGGTATIPYVADTANANDRIGAICNSSGCSLNITGGLGGSQYYMRLISVYKNASLVTISAYDASGNPIGLENSQAVVDVTGKAQDVLRRVQVHIPIAIAAGPNQLSDYAIESTDAICKRFAVMTGQFFQSSSGIGSPKAAICGP